MCVVRLPGSFLLAFIESDAEGSQVSSHDRLPRAITRNLDITMIFCLTSLGSLLCELIHIEN